MIVAGVAGVARKVFRPCLGLHLGVRIVKSEASFWKRMGGNYNFDYWMRRGISYKVTPTDPKKNFDEEALRLRKVSEIKEIVSENQRLSKKLWEIRSKKFSQNQSALDKHNAFEKTMTDTLKAVEVSSCSFLFKLHRDAMTTQKQVERDLQMELLRSDRKKIVFRLY